MIIAIDTNKCSKCSVCIQSCPLSIIHFDDNKYPEILADKEKSCIYCGHCESICPEAALTHTLAAKAMEPITTENAEIEPEVLGKYFRNRRSIRNYQNKRVERKILEEIMDVVRYSPTGTNRQFNQWVIVHDTEVVKKLAAGTINWMKTMSDINPALAAGYNFPGIVASFERGSDRICRNAPHLIISYTLTAYPLGAKDATIATSHLELLVPSYGLGACWAGFLMMALQSVPEMRQMIGLTDKHTLHAALMLGYPKYKYFKAPVRNKANIKWI